MSTTQSDRLRELLEPLVAAKGLDLEEIEVSKAGRRRMLRIVVDSEEGVELDACAEVSRAISDKLDESDAMGDEEYVLEVGSPGADRPLTEHRHYVRATGRLAKLTLTDGAELIARILAVDEAGLDLEVPGVKGRKPTARRVEFADIAKARVEVEFNRKDDDNKKIVNDEKEEEA
ncbi:ribosome maturation factor RimP [Streptomyces sp. NPDC021093]|uniref:ribosome maturation factor RimP n=1 Tax=Streptomyces sp. NPDC021093 TaxID=3365112 RepID=UPI0037B26501